jgi:hypothetical protein
MASPPSRARQPGIMPGQPGSMEAWPGSMLLSSLPIDLPLSLPQPLPLPTAAAVILAGCLSPSGICTLANCLPATPACVLSAPCREARG